MPTLRHYEELAPLFEYPDAEYRGRVWSAHASLASAYPGAADRLVSLAAALPGGPGALAPAALAELQEIYTRSFDVQAITTLSVGYLVFGDDYKRGELLANLNREEHDAGVDPGVELPDHLPNVLRLMARWSEQELVAELVEEIVRPAVQRMIAEFSPKRTEQRDQLYRKHYRTLIASSTTRFTIFREPLAALAIVLDQDFEPAERARSQVTSDFLSSIGQELDLEASEGRPAKSGRLS